MNVTNPTSQKCKKMIVVNEFKCLVSLSKFFVFAFFYKKDGISNIILLKLYNNINTDHLGRTSPCPTPHRIVNFDNLHKTVSIPDSLY